MAIPLTQEQLDDLEMSKSVMDAPRSGFQRLTDFLFGRTVPERMTSALTTPLGSAQIAKVAPQIADPTMINRALRAMGREALNYMRKTGQTVDVVPERVSGQSGAYIRGTQKHIVKLAKNVGEDTTFHEIPGHMGEGILPDALRKAEQQAQASQLITERIQNPRLIKGLKQQGYQEKDLPGELNAMAHEGARRSGLRPSAQTIVKSLQRSRQRRKDLRDLMRQMFEEEGTAAEATPDLMSLLRNMGPRVDPNAEVFEKNARVIRPLLGGNK